MATHSRHRAPQEQIDEFVAANKRWRVVSAATRPGEARYKLENTKWYRLGTAALELMPEGFPKWSVG